MDDYTATDLKELGAKWIKRIQAAEHREDRWRKDAASADKFYLADEGSDAMGPVPEFNILHSNVETIVPSIYNSTPVPDIRPRHNSQDPLAKLVAEIYERAISVQIDDNRLDSEVEKLAQDAFVAGRGIVRIRFDADVEMGAVTNERLEFEVVAWDDYREGAARKWKDVPWVAYRHWLTQDDLKNIDNPDLAELREKDSIPTDEPKGDVAVWEIWCKDTEKVYFVTADTEKVLDVKDDPLGLEGFFPQAEPVQPITGTGSRTPVCPFAIYKVQAEELDRITTRIRGIVSGLKVRGIAVGDASDLDRLAEAGDNELIVASNMEGIVAAGGLEKAVMWWPIETAVNVLRELFVQREQVKQTIYEITGISDIIRGQSAASETATAQQIKTEWGALRIKKMQRLIERQVRDIFVICADIISRHFSLETLQRLSGMQIPPEAREMLQAPLDHYRIDVESDSTVRADTSRNRQEMADFLAGTGQFFSAMAPLVQQSPAAAEPIAAIYGSFCRQFNLGKQAEDALERLVEMAKQAAQNPPPNPEAEARQAEMQLKTMDLQDKAADRQQKGQLEAAKIVAETRNKEADTMLKGAELELKQQELGLREAEAEVQAGATMLQLEQAENAMENEKNASSD